MVSKPASQFASRQSARRSSNAATADGGQAPPPLGRRGFLADLAGWGAAGLGGLALADLLAGEGAGGAREAGAGELPGADELASGAARGLRGHFPPRARRVILLFMSGAPSQLDLFDPKPLLQRRHGEELPESVRRGQRLTGMTADQPNKPLAGSPFRFDRHGDSGAELSELLPHTARIADQLCFVRSMHTEAINHNPAMNLFQTGSQIPGRPCIGSWVSYGLASGRDALPRFLVMLSGGEPGDQPLSSRLWQAGFLPPEHQGIKFRGGRDPVLFLANPPGQNRAVRRTMLDGIAALNRLRAAEVDDPAIEARIADYEAAFAMQRSLPELLDIRSESPQVLARYGPAAQQPGTFAGNCLLARRMVERGVKFVQLYHRGWDHHESLPSKIRMRCEETDQPAAALVEDLRQRGLLEDTLVVWAGEFGRTAYCQGPLTKQSFGRDHHPRAFTIWLAGGGIRPGQTVGRTDDFSYNIVEDPIHIHDLHATMLRLLGFDHQRLVYRHRGRDFRLTDVAGRVVEKLIG